MPSGEEMEDEEEWDASQWEPTPEGKKGSKAEKRSVTEKAGGAAAHGWLLER